MEKVEFVHHWVNSRKDLLHFVEENGDRQVYEHIGENPDAWVDELCIVSQILTREGLVAGIDTHQPPIDEPDFRKLGENVFLYRGKYNQLRGLWTSRKVEKDLEEITGRPLEWTRYAMGTRAELKVNKEFSNVPIEQFLPENFEKIAKPVEKSKGPNKRPLFTFSVNVGGREVLVYAKGADICLRKFYDYAKPKYRLTSIVDISRTTSKEEMETTLKLGSFGVKVPRVIGYYKAPAEEFLFLEEVAGKHPNKCPYCAVSRTEPEQWINPNWKKHIDLAKPCVMISDNNLSSQPIEHVKEVCNFLIEHKKKVIFDNGFDCKYITPEIAELLSRLKYMPSGLRLAFDRISDDVVFQKAIKRLLDAGVRKHNIMAYILFNFLDTPKEAIYRANECVKLGIHPYPQMYTPLNKKDRKDTFIGKHWTKNLAGAFRFFYLMAGYYKKYHFIDWFLNNNKFEPTEEDFVCLGISISLMISDQIICEVKNQ